MLNGGGPEYGTNNRIARTIWFECKVEKRSCPLARLSARLPRMVTKRQLGIAFIGIAVLAVVGSFVYDFIGAGQFSGVGPAQRLALIGAGVLALVGVTLLPLGERPA